MLIITCSCGKPAVPGMGCCYPCYLAIVKAHMAQNWRGVR